MAASMRSVPRASRHRAVLEMEFRGVPLFRSNRKLVADDGNKVIREQTSTKKILSTIAYVWTGPCLLQKGKEMANMKVMLMGKKVGSENLELLVCHVSIPQNWTPHHYITALYLSAMVHQIVVIEPLDCAENECSTSYDDTMNRIHSLYHCEESKHRIETSYEFHHRVSGGKSVSWRDE